MAADTRSKANKEPIEPSPRTRRRTGVTGSATDDGRALYLEQQEPSEGRGGLDHASGRQEPRPRNAKSSETTHHRARRWAWLGGLAVAGGALWYMGRRKARGKQQRQMRRF